MFTEFYCDTATGANVNGGSDAGSPSMSDTAGTGSWVSTTQIYTSVATNGSVAVGQFMSIYSGAATVATTTARITAVSGGGGSAWVITLDNFLYSGTQPSALTTGATYKAQVGGAWKGPNGTAGFPFGYISGSMHDGTLRPRVNFKNNATYSVTAAISHNVSGQTRFQGYSSTVGDGGKAIIDGGTSGASYVLLTVNNVGPIHLVDLIFQNNGATGSATGVSFTGGNALRWHVSRCVFNSFRGHGFSSSGAGLNGAIDECEAYACNQSNTANLAGFDLQTTVFGRRLIAHDNTGSNTSGFRIGVGASLSNCIADSNGSNGVDITSSSTYRLESCDFYNNGGHGIGESGTGQRTVVIENCNLVKNGLYGMAFTNVIFGAIRNCGFGAGTQANSSGQTSGIPLLEVEGTVTYAADVAPWVDPANGDFRINLAAAKGTGRGTYTQTASSYAGTVAYPDIGAAQHLEVPGGVFVKRITRYHRGAEHVRVSRPMFGGDVQHVPILGKSRLIEAICTVRKPITLPVPFDVPFPVRTKPKVVQVTHQARRTAVIFDSPRDVPFPMRTRPKSIPVYYPLRRRSADALFSSVTNTETVLVASYRKVR